MAKDYTPDKDASLGLIYRLNNLWVEADSCAKNGKYVLWDVILDTIWRNLLFEGNTEVIKNEANGKIIKIKLSKKDFDIVGFHNLNIAKAKINFKRERDKRKKLILRSRWYHALQYKDISLRKFMQKLKLYLKVTEMSPGTSTYGTFGNK